MILREFLTIAIQNLWRLKLRSILTISGVMIGIGALVSMLSFGNGMQKNVSGEFKKMGLLRTMQVFSGPAPGDERGGAGGGADPEQIGAAGRAARAREAANTGHAAGFSVARSCGAPSGSGRHRPDRGPRRRDARLSPGVVRCSDRVGSPQRSRQGAGAPGGVREAASLRRDPGTLLLLGRRERGGGWQGVAGEHRRRSRFRAGRFDHDPSHRKRRGLPGDRAARTHADGCSRRRDGRRGQESARPFYPSCSAAPQPG